MELRINVGYKELLDLILQLPASQIAKLRKELDKIPTEKDHTDFQELLLQGPIMDDLQYQVFKENREFFNQWRKR